MLALYVRPNKATHRWKYSPRRGVGPARGEACYKRYAYDFDSYRSAAVQLPL